MVRPRIGSQAGSYLRRIDSCITQLEAQGPSTTFNESKKEPRGVDHGTGFGFRVPDFEFRVSGFSLFLRVEAAGFGIQGAGAVLRARTSPPLGSSLLWLQVLKRLRAKGCGPRQRGFGRFRVFLSSRRLRASSLLGPGARGFHPKTSIFL